MSISPDRNTSFDILVMMHLPDVNTTEIDVHACVQGIVRQIATPLVAATVQTTAAAATLAQTNTILPVAPAAIPTLVAAK